MNRTEAAAARALKYRSLGDRPSQRGADPGAYQINRAAGLLAPTPSIRSVITIERAAAGSATPDAVRFEGMASVTGQPYVMYDFLGEYDEVVAEDAFDVTLAQDDLQVPLVLSHDSMRRIAQLGNAASPLQLAAVKGTDHNGLSSIAPSLQMTDPDTIYIVPKLELGLIDEMSFRFTIDAGRWSDDFTTYTIQRVNLHRGDVAIVGYGASPHTAGSGLREAKLTPFDLLRMVGSAADDGKYDRAVR